MSSTSVQSELYSPEFASTWSRHSLYGLAVWINGMAFKDIDFTLVGTPVIKISEIKNGVSGQTKFTQATYDEKYFLNNGDMLFCWSGQPETSIDTYWWRCGDGWLNQHIFKVLPNQEIVQRDFFYQLLRYMRPTFVQIARNKQTTGLGHVTKTDLQRLVVAIPAIEEQRGIAATLGALDDKIESNRRAIDLLETLAHTYFVNWREQTEILKTETFGSFTEVYGGATPRTNEPDYWDGGLVWTTPTDVTRLASPYLFSTSRTISESGLDSCTAVMHPVGSIFMTSRATIGAFAVNQIPASTNQGFIVVRPRRDADRWFLFEEMRARVQEFLDNANGSTFLEISRGRFKELPLEVPAAEAIDELDSQLAPLHAKAAQLAEESSSLELLRDTLLPELLSGRIRGPEASGVAS